MRRERELRIPRTIVNGFTPEHFGPWRAVHDRGNVFTIMEGAVGV
jgi:hypothetical protein